MHIFFGISEIIIKFAGHKQKQAMRLLTTTIIMLCSVIAARGQLSIDGRSACYDRTTNTLLATVPRSMFGMSPSLAVSLDDDAWSSLSINGIPLDSASYCFTKITATSNYVVTLTDTLGNTVDRNLHFTFLPIMQLHGDFGYDYSGGLVNLSDPTANMTVVLGANIKWRGGMTNTNSKHKRNYKIKLDVDSALLGMRHDDSWMLDAGQPDVFRLRNRIAMDIWNRMATPPYYIDQEPEARNGVSGRVVEVFLNDEYRGFYNLSELIDRQQMKLKKVERNSNIIHGCLYKCISWDHAMLYSKFDDYDNHSEALYGFEVKYPDLSDCDTTDWRPLVEATNFALESSDEDFINHIEEYFDLPVLADYMVFGSSLNAVDNYGKNVYWAVYDKQTTHRLTPAAWDLDCTLGQRWGGTLGDLSKYNLIMDMDIHVGYRLLKLKAHGFKERLQQRYTELRSSGILNTDSLLQLITRYYDEIILSGAACREADLWSGDTDIKGEEIDFDAEYAYICNWIQRHLRIIDRLGMPLEYTDEYFEKLNNCIWPSVVTSLPTYYNLQGQPVGPKPQKPGIYISQGRKVVIK